MYSWGVGADGRLGHGDEADSSVPRLIRALEGKSVSVIACGSEHSLAITGTLLPRLGGE